MELWTLVRFDIIKNLLICELSGRHVVVVGVVVVVLDVGVGGSCRCTINLLICELARQHVVRRRLLCTLAPITAQ